MQAISVAPRTYALESTCNLTLVILHTLVVRTGNFRVNACKHGLCQQIIMVRILPSQLRQYWGLPEEQQNCITTDNGSNLVRACRVLDQLHIPCFGHNLHLAINSVIKDDPHVARALGMIRN